MTDAVTTSIIAEGGVDLVQGMVAMLIAGLVMVLGALVFGMFLRPKLPHPDKLQPYECGEPTIGPSWVQFDLRFYVVALVFLVFDVEVALFYPWAVVFGAGNHAVKVAATWDMLFFFSVIVVGFLYLWRFGYLDWVWASTGGRGNERKPIIGAPIPPPEPKKVQRTGI